MFFSHKNMVFFWQFSIANIVLYYFLSGKGEDNIVLLSWLTILCVVGLIREFTLKHNGIMEFSNKFYADKNKNNRP